jgi:hypothetical protein
MMDPMETGAFTLNGGVPSLLIKVAEQFEKDGYTQAGQWSGHDWDVMWSLGDPYAGERPVSPLLLKVSQLVNQYPSSPFVMKSRLAQLPFPFIPSAFNLPEQMHAFREAYRSQPELQWIRKSRNHRGVYLTSPHEAELFLRGQAPPTFVQEFVHPPYLISGRKWDIGVFVLLTSLKPLRLYAYDDVVLRFCPKDYPSEPVAEDVGTYVVSDDYAPMWDLPAFGPYREGRRCATELRTYFARQEPGLDWEDHFRTQCLRAVHEVITAYAEEMLQRCADFPAGQHQFFELYRFDFLFNERLQASLMEVNMSPSLTPSARGHLDYLYTRLVRDVFSLVGISGGRHVLERKRQNPEFRASWEQANSEHWLPVHEESNQGASKIQDAPGRPNGSVSEATRSTVADDWAAGNGIQADASHFRFSLHGAVVQIQLPSTMALVALQDRLPPGLVQEAEVPADVIYRVGTDFNLFRGEELQLRAASMDEALNALVSDLHFQIACHARTALFVHAGVVALHGRGILFPGRTFSGKSTMVAALVQAGATYYSDEYAVLDRQGCVHPYLKPISLRDANGIGRPHSVDSLGGQSGSKPVPVGLIVCTKYRAAAVWDPQSLSPAHSILAMVENTVRAREMPELMMGVLSTVARNASAIESERGDAGEVIRAILEKHAKA